MKNILITNIGLASSEDDYLKKIANSNADIIIFREKSLSSSKAQELIEKIKLMIKDTNQCLIVNHHHQVARKLMIDKLHFGFEDYCRNRNLIKKLSEQGVSIGVSIHSLEQLHTIDQQIVNYLLVGTIFPTDCKPGVSTLGPSGLQAIIDQTELPIIAIGGINEKTIKLLEPLPLFGVARMSSYFK